MHVREPKSVTAVRLLPVHVAASGVEIVCVLDDRVGGAAAKAAQINENTNALVSEECSRLFRELGYRRADVHVPHALQLRATSGVPHVFGTSDTPLPPMLPVAGPGPL